MNIHKVEPQRLEQLRKMEVDRERHIDELRRLSMERQQSRGRRNGGTTPLRSSSAIAKAEPEAEPIIVPTVDEIVSTPLASVPPALSQGSEDTDAHPWETVAVAPPPVWTETANGTAEESQIVSEPALPDTRERVLEERIWNLEQRVASLEARLTAVGR